MIDNHFHIKVLIVDKITDMRKILKGLMKNLGFLNISEAEDGSSALQLLKEDSYGLVISEWNMPSMSGLELLKAIRSDENLKEIFFVLVTAEATKENIIEAIQSGANNYIVKPFTTDILQKKLEEVLH